VFRYPTGLACLHEIEVLLRRCHNVLASGSMLNFCEGLASMPVRLWLCLDELEVTLSIVRQQ
jgi:hypothetical protein